MPGCPFANPLDPTTYVEGMPCAELARIREAGPLVKTG